MARRSLDSYTQERIYTDLRHIVRAIVEDRVRRDRRFEECGYVEQLGFETGPSDPRLRDLQALRSIRQSVEKMIDDRITSSRRGDPQLSWRAIGDAVGMSGQAVRRRAHAKQLPVAVMSATTYMDIVDEARAARGLPPLPSDTRPPPSVEMYDVLLQRPPREGDASED